MAQNTLFVCVLCRFSETATEQDQPHPGQVFFNRLRDELARSPQSDLHLQPVRCMGACSRACVVAFAAPSKLTFILSELSPTDAVPDLLTFSRQYSSCSDGKVPYQERPPTVKQKIHAVLPCLPEVSPIKPKTQNAVLPALRATQHFGFWV